jgi:hypothetical protein
MSWLLGLEPWVNRSLSSAPVTGAMSHCMTLNRLSSAGRKTNWAGSLTGSRRRATSGPSNELQSWKRFKSNLIALRPLRVPIS